MHRDVAQLGSALRSGRRGRRFKSCHPDHDAGKASKEAFFMFQADKEKIVTIHSRSKPVKWKTKEIIFCLKANQRLSGRCDLSGC